MHSLLVRRDRAETLQRERLELALNSRFRSRTSSVFLPYTRTTATSPVALSEHLNTREGRQSAVLTTKRLGQSWVTACKQGGAEPHLVKSGFGVESKKDELSRSSVEEVTSVVETALASLNSNVVGCPVWQQGQQHSTHVAMRSVVPVAAYSAVHMSKGVALLSGFGERHGQRSGVRRFFSTTILFRFCDGHSDKCRAVTNSLLTSGVPMCVNEAPRVEAHSDADFCKFPPPPKFR